MVLVFGEAKAACLSQGKFLAGRGPRFLNFLRAYYQEMTA